MKSSCQTPPFFFLNHLPSPLPFRLTNYNSKLILREKKQKQKSPAIRPALLFRRAHSAGEMFLSGCVTPTGLGSHTELPSAHFFTGLGGWRVKTGSLRLAHSPSPPPGLVKALVHLFSSHQRYQLQDKKQCIGKQSLHSRGLVRGPLS